MDVRRVMAIDIGGSKLLTAVVEITQGAEYSIPNGNGRHPLEAQGADGGKVSPSDGGQGRKGRFFGVAKCELDRHCGKEGVLNRLADAIEETLRLTGFTWGEIDAMGVTIPGLADPASGMWVYAPFSGIGDFPIASILRERYGKPVYIENDVNACAWAEKIFGVCQSANDFLWITISNGIGGGLILDGKIYTGAFGAAAEIGHFNIVENGALCGCGNRGCLEAEAAGPAIARRFEERLGQNTGETRQRVDLLKWKKRIPTDRPLGAAEIAYLARSGDLIAKDVFDTTGRYVGRAAAMAANLINPSCIVIGGGVAGAFDLFEPQMVQTFKSQVFHDANKEVRILKTGLGYEAGLYAAASLVY